MEDGGLRGAQVSQGDKLVALALVTLATGLAVEIVVTSVEWTLLGVHHGLAGLLLGGAAAAVGFCLVMVAYVVAVFRLWAERGRARLWGFSLAVAFAMAWLSGPLAGLLFGVLGVSEAAAGV